MIVPDLARKHSLMLALIGFRIGVVSLIQCFNANNK